MAWRWTAQRVSCAQLVAEDIRKDEEIAEIVGISVRTLYGWKLREEFIERVDELVAAVEERAEASWIGRRSARVARLMKRADQINGLLRNTKHCYGREFAALSREERGLMEQAAKELGQLAREDPGTDGAREPGSAVRPCSDALTALAARLGAGGAQPPAGPQA